MERINRTLLTEQITGLVSNALDQEYQSGYEKGCADTEEKLKPQPEPTPEPEPEPTPIGPPVYTLENPGVEGFMADQTYYQPGFATTNGGMTVVDKYNQDAVEGLKPSPTEQPARIPLEFAALTDEKGNRIPIINGIYNLIPGHKYTYFKKVGNNEVACGVFRTKPNTVRMIHMADDCPVSNMRDIGGYPCEGGHIAYNKIIQSATTKFLTADCVNTRILKEAIGITDEITFSSSNPARTDMGLWTGTHYDMHAYSYVLTKTNYYPNIKSTIKRIITKLDAGGCVLIHCFAGADRTGSVLALILGVCGVCEGDIIKMWEMTSFCGWFNFMRISDWETRADIKKECPEGQLRQMFQKMKSLFGKNGETFQQQCEAFLTKKVGLTKDNINLLKKHLISE